MKQTKRPIRKARRKARRAKVKTAADRWRQSMYVQIMDLDKRMTRVEEFVDAALEIQRRDEVYRKADAERAAKS